MDRIHIESRKMRKLVAAASLLILVLVGSACTDSKADIASHNLSKAAEQFEIERRIVFFNGITDKYLLTVEGRCSVETGESALGGSLEVTCKIGPNEYKKHFLGLSDNVSFFVEQIESANVSEYHYRVIFRPETIVPAIEVDVD
jgi:hypothetical protein